MANLAAVMIVIVVAVDVAAEKIDAETAESADAAYDVDSNNYKTKNVNY